ncbi:MAG: translation initiation factor IF-3 [Alphaproteobacteria bacterium]|nr:translation initiation factor IF-3 [Alphaproteobacteria bacterium]
MEDKKHSEEKYRINREITAPQVRLIGQDGESFGVLSIREAAIKARDAGLDLVEIAPQANPPVCKIINYGKLKYELQKKKSEARKKQKVVEVKEVKLTPAIGDHDYNVKLNNVRRFIGDGNKVKITLRFRGRELSHKELGEKLLQRLLDDVKETAKCDGTPQLEGRQMMMILSPASTK